jgi:hypothetical protein
VSLIEAVKGGGCNRDQDRKKEEFFLKKLQIDVALNVIERVSSLTVWNGHTEVRWVMSLGSAWCGNTSDCSRDIVKKRNKAQHFVHTRCGLYTGERDVATVCVCFTSYGLTL